MSCRGLRICVFTIVITLLWPQLPFANGAETAAHSTHPYVTRSVRGQVVWLADAVSRLHTVKTVAEARERILAVETAEGQLYPIIEDIRGRAFRRDERLRKMQVELLTRQYRGLPMVQVIRVFELTEAGKFEIDYWCEICSISMFELKDCECCQGPIELRRQPAASR